VNFSFAFNRVRISRSLATILVVTLVQTIGGPVLAPLASSPPASAANSAIIQSNLALNANATAGSNDVASQMTLVRSPVHTNTGVGYYTFNNTGVATASQKYAYKQIDFANGAVGANVSIFMWVYPTAAGVILSHSGQADPFDLYRLTTFNYTSAGKFEVGLYNNAPIYTASTSLTTPLNNWYYLGLTYDGAIIRGYLNGKEFNTVSMSNWTTSASDFFHIGTSQSGTCFSVACSNSNAATFRMGEFIVYRSTLSAADVYANFEATTNRFGPTIGSPSSQSKLLNSSATFSIPECTATTSGSTSCSYTWQLSTDGGSSYSNISGANSVSYSIPMLTRANSGHKYRIVAYDPGFGSPTSDALFTISSPATLSVSFPDSETDTALLFNGVNQYAAAPSDANGSIYDFGSTWTTQAWIKPGANCVAGYCNIIGKEYSFLLSTIGNKLIFCTGNGTGWNIIWREAGGFVPTGAWSHVATTYTGTTLTIYLNGQPTHISNSVSAVGNNNERFTVGARTVLANGDTSFERFQGEIDEVRVWNSARSQANIQSDMHNRPTLSDATLKAYFDFNEGSGTALINRATNSFAQTDLSSTGAPSWQDIKEVSTSEAYTVTKFPRSYLTASGGWKVPSGVSRVTALVVAGGGGGGNGYDNGAGAGGGGGMVRQTNFSLQALETYAVTVGAGGAGGADSRTISSGTSGGNSNFANVLSLGGGGGGGSYADGTGLKGTGQSGTSTSATGGKSGGNATSGGGGGGSSANGTDGSPSSVGIGGSGTVATSFSAITTFGIGGNGARGFMVNGGGAGTALTGNGGEGAGSLSSSSRAGGYGGSGIVIVRWITAAKPIFTGPAFDTLTAGLTETFTVSGSPISPLTRNFRWQTSNDTGTTWSNTSSGSGFLTSNYTTLTLETSTSGIRNQYRVVVTDSDTAGLFIVETSTAVFLTINPRNTITSSTGSAIFTQKYGESRTAVFSFAFGTGTRTSSVLTTDNNQNGRITWSNLNGESATVRVGTGLPVGTYYETLTVTDSVTAFTSQGLRITVSKADTITITTTLSSNSVVYNELPANVTVNQTVTGLVNSETMTITTTYGDITPCASGGPCKIGDAAPGGGKVFYVSATEINSASGISSGGKYLATAPNNWVTIAGLGTYYHQFGCNNQTFSGITDSIGSGAANTQILAAQACGVTNGGKTVADATINGYSDWIMPSIEELKIMNTNLYIPALATRLATVLWSSIPDPGNVYAAYFVNSSGTATSSARGNSSNQGIYIMPIRAFNVEPSQNLVPTDAGTYRVGASYLLSAPALLSNYQGIESITATLTINMARQKALSIGQYEAYPNVSSYPLNVYGGSGPGVLTVTLLVSESNTAGCSLLSSRIITATSVGSCRVQAVKAGTRNYFVESTTAVITWIVWSANYAVQSLGGNHSIPLTGGNQFTVRTETVTASAFSDASGNPISSATVGTTIRINSTGFAGLTPAQITATFRPYEDGVVTAVTSTYVEVVVPAGAITGVIALDSPRGVAYTPSCTISP